MEGEKKKLIESGLITTEDIAKMEAETGQDQTSSEVAAMDVEEEE